MIAAYVLLIILLCTFVFSTKYEKSDLMHRDATDAIKGLTIMLICLHHTYLCKFLGVMGAVGTGIFFMFSGWGNTLSINKEKNGGVFLGL